MYNYKHSENFGRMKRIKEDVQTNYTTSQWLTTLDFFIEAAIDPIVIVNPELSDNFFAKAVCFQFHKPSFRFTQVDKSTLGSTLFNSLTTNGKDKRHHQKMLGMHRGIRMGLVSVFEKTVNMKYASPFEKVSKVKRLLALKKLGDHYYEAVMQSKYCSNKAVKIKNTLEEKFVRMALNNAKSLYVEVKHQYDFDDLQQKFLLCMSRAIDRCDSKKGVLSSFIQNWFMSVKAEVRESINQTTEFTDYENDMVISDSSEDLENKQHIRFVAKKIDSYGLMTFMLGIPPYIKNSDLKKLNNYKE